MPGGIGKGSGLYRDAEGKEPPKTRPQMMTEWIQSQPPKHRKGWDKYINDPWLHLLIGILLAIIIGGIVGWLN